MLIDRITYIQKPLSESFYPKAEAADFNEKQFSDLRQEREAMIQFSHIVQQEIHHLTIVQRHGSIDPKVTADHIYKKMKELNDAYEMKFAWVVELHRPKGIVSIEIANIKKQTITIWLKP